MKLAREIERVNAGSLEFSRELLQFAAGIGQRFVAMLWYHDVSAVCSNLKSLQSR
jgi:hypothetical protein